MLVFAAALLAAFYLWSYGDCLGAFFLNDDYWVLRAANGIVLESPIDLARFFRPEPFFLLYRPVTTLMYFYALRELFGHDPMRYHAVQLTVHVLNAILVYGISTRLFRAPAAGLAAALIYATAPGHAIAILWMVLITMSGTAFFYFLAFYVWISVAADTSGRFSSHGGAYGGGAADLGVINCSAPATPQDGECWYSATDVTRYCRMGGKTVAVLKAP
jgi:hypothetical protein